MPSLPSMGMIYCQTQVNIMRHAFTLIELIVSIIVIGLAFSAISLILQQESKIEIENIKQEAVTIASTKARELFYLNWNDLNDTNISIPNELIGQYGYKDKYKIFTKIDYPNNNIKDFNITIKDGNNKQIVSIVAFRVNITNQYLLTRKW